MTLRTNRVPGETITAADVNGIAAEVNAVGSVLHIAAPEMVATFGVPTLAGFGSAADKTTTAWLLDAGSFENVSGHVLIPPGWATVDVVMWWSNAGSGAGNVLFGLVTELRGDGATIGAAQAFAPPTARVAPAQHVAKVEVLVTALAVVPGRILGFRLQRDGGHTNDTLPNDAALLGIEIRRAS